MPKTYAILDSSAKRARETEMTKNEAKSELRKIVARTTGKTRQAVAETVSDLIIVAECNAPRAMEVWGTEYCIAYHGDGLYTISS